MLEIRNFTQNEIDESLLKNITKNVLKEVGIKEKTEISLAIVGDGRMRRLNKMYRGKNRVTDVLSFESKPASSGGGLVIPYLAKAFPRLKKNKDIEFIDPPDNIKRLGEIIICYPQAKKQAKKLNHSLEEELTILLIHGTLHLLGYDHEGDLKKAKEMNDLENIILNKIKK